MHFEFLYDIFCKYLFSPFDLWNILILKFLLVFILDDLSVDKNEVLNSYTHPCVYTQTFCLLVFNKVGTFFKHIHLLE